MRTPWPAPWALASIVAHVMVSGPALADPHPILDLLEDEVGPTERIEASTLSALDKIPDKAIEELFPLLLEAHNKMTVERGEDGTFAVALWEDDGLELLSRITSKLKSYLKPEQIVDLGMASLFGEGGLKGDSKREMIAGLAGAAALGLMFDSDSLKAELTPVKIVPEGGKGFLLTIKGKVADFGKSLDPTAKLEAHAGYRFSKDAVIFADGALLILDREQRVKAGLGAVVDDVKLSLSGYHGLDTDSRGLAFQAQLEDVTVGGKVGETSSGDWTAEGSFDLHGGTPDLYGSLHIAGGKGLPPAFGLPGQTAGYLSVAASIVFAPTGEHSLGMSGSLGVDGDCDITASGSLALGLADDWDLVARASYYEKTGAYAAGLELTKPMESSREVLGDALKSLASRVRVSLADIREAEAELLEAGESARGEELERELKRLRNGLGPLLQRYEEMASRYLATGGPAKFQLTRPEIEEAQKGDSHLFADQ